MTPKAFNIPYSEVHMYELFNRHCAFTTLQFCAAVFRRAVHLTLSL